MGRVGYAMIGGIRGYIKETQQHKVMLIYFTRLNNDVFTVRQANSMHVYECKTGLFVCLYGFHFLCTTF